MLVGIATSEDHHHPRRCEAAQAARRQVEELRRRADAITARLLFGDEPRIDLEIAIGSLRDDVERDMPDRVWLFELVYEARWERLRAQGWARPQEPDLQ